MNNMSLIGLIAGALLGFAVTAAVTLLWPKNKLRFLRPVAAAGLGVGIAYIVMISL